MLYINHILLETFTLVSVIAYTKLLCMKTSLSVYFYVPTLSGKSEAFKQPLYFRNTAYNVC